MTEVSGGGPGRGGQSSEGTWVHKQAARRHPDILGPGLQGRGGREDGDVDGLECQVKDLGFSSMRWEMAECFSQLRRCRGPLKVSASRTWVQKKHRLRKGSLPGSETSQTHFLKLRAAQGLCFLFCSVPTPGPWRADRISKHITRICSGTWKNHPRLLGLILKVN